MLNEQLSQQIVTDAEELTKGFKDTNYYEAGIIQGYKEGYEDAGEKYAALWQAAEEKAEKAQHLVGATIEKVIDLMEFVAEAKGHVSDEEIISQVRKSLPEILEALTPKTGEDE